jgi:hypothetical protein
VEMLKVLVPTLIILGLINVVVFLIFREFVCWYWKINEHMGHMLEIKASLQQMQQQLAGSGVAGAAVAIAPAMTLASPPCRACGKSVNAGVKFCEYCGAAQIA